MKRIILVVTVAVVMAALIISAGGTAIAAQTTVGTSACDVQQNRSVFSEFNRAEQGTGVSFTQGDECFIISNAF
jgi:hypothetical protein